MTLKKQMDKKDWEDKKKTFLEMQVKATENKNNVVAQLEELEVFLEAINAKIKTFK